MQLSPTPSGETQNRMVFMVEKMQRITYNIENDIPFRHFHHLNEDRWIRYICEFSMLVRFIAYNKGVILKNRGLYDDRSVVGRKRYLYFRSVLV